MIQCPECRQLIPDDSAFCDQCGKELKWCPECKRPKRGTECPVCGSDLVPGRKWLNAEASSAGKATDSDPVRGSAAHPPQPDGGVERSETSAGAVAATALTGNGWKLSLQAGPFGRRGGIWPELSSCQYVSGNHGRVEKDANGWLLVDVGSTNGTFVNGKRIQKEYIKKGDKVRIATLDFIVE